MAKNERPMSWLWKVMLAAGVGTIAVWVAKRYRGPLRERGREWATLASDQSKRAAGMLGEKWQVLRSAAEKEIASHPTAQSASDLINRASQKMAETQETAAEYARELGPSLRVSPLTYRRIKRKPLQRKD